MRNLNFFLLSSEGFSLIPTLFFSPERLGTGREIPIALHGGIVEDLLVLKKYPEGVVAARWNKSYP